MMLTELTSVPETALPLTQLKDHLRLGSGFAEDALQDDLLRGYLRSALSMIENRTDKVLFERNFEWVLFEWRSFRLQPLPLAPISSVVQVRTEDQAGELSDPLSGWSVKNHAQRPVLAATGACLPTIPSDHSMRIEIIAGFGPAWGDVPSDLQQAVLMLAAHFYEHRAADADGTGIPAAVRTLIAPYRKVRLSMGNV